MDEVILLSPAGEQIGTAPKSAVHTHETPLHLAFSCYLFDADGRLLMTRRSLDKRTWPGVWTNSFCGHPRPGETVVDAVRRHALLELGADLSELNLELPLFQYRATDASGVVENELCPVYSAQLASDLHPAPAEVMDHRWVEVSEVAEAARLTPWAFSPWFVLQVELLDLFRAKAAA